MHKRRICEGDFGFKRVCNEGDENLKKTVFSRSLSKHELKIDIFKLPCDTSETTFVQALGPGLEDAQDRSLMFMKSSLKSTGKCRTLAEKMIDTPRILKIRSRKTV